MRGFEFGGLKVQGFRASGLGFKALGEAILTVYLEQYRNQSYL